MGRLLKRELACAIAVAVALAGVMVGTANAGTATRPTTVDRALAQGQAQDRAAAAPRRGQRPGTVRRVRVGDGRTNGSAARLVVRWATAPGAASYQVSVSNNRAMRGGRVVRTRQTSLAVGRLRAGRAYCVRVRAVRGARRGTPSARVCARTPKPVRTAGAPWVVAQEVRSGSTRLTLSWRRTGRASSYDLIYAAGATALRTRAVKVQRGVRASGRSVESVVVGGLEPGRIFCFQVRGRARTGVGARGPVHCKVAQPASRALQPSRLAVKIATFNICGRAPKCQRVAWSKRRAAIDQHLAETGADAIALQETRSRLADVAADLRRRGFVQACSAAGAQAVFVRASVYAAETWRAGGLRFAGDRSHGACWVVLRHRATGARVVATSIHLRVGPGTAASEMRARQSRQVLGLLEAAYGKLGDPRTPPFLLSGDFNSHRSYRLDGPRRELARSGFADAYDVSATYAAPYRSSAHGRHRTKPRITTRWGAHVDRVFVPRGASVTGWRTVMHLRNGRFVQPLPSDHSPVVVTVYLPHTPGGLLGGLLGGR